MKDYKLQSNLHECIKWPCILKSVAKKILRLITVNLTSSYHYVFYSCKLIVIFPIFIS